MKVKELIKILRQCPQNCEVLIDEPMRENSIEIQTVSHIVGGSNGCIEPYVAIEIHEQ